MTSVSHNRLIASRQPFGNPWMILQIFGSVLLMAVALFGAYKCWHRLSLSRAKYPSLSGHARWSRRLARWVPYFEYSETEFFASDGAGRTIAGLRRENFFALATQLRERAPRGVQATDELSKSVSDLQFTKAYRVPFPFRALVQRHFPADSLLSASRGVQVRDIDGNWSYDLSGSYGVNVLGYDFYKSCIAAGHEEVAELGPVLGAYHPTITSIVENLRGISGLDEVSFHMSGTEAVMQAVRLARYHTGRSHAVRFCGAYHGWWDGVQPGVGNQRRVNDVYTLSDMSERTLHVLRTRNDIACVLVNPLQALHPNQDPSGDGYLLNSSRGAKLDKEGYGNWLQELRRVCTERGIVLIFDEVFTGFRLAYRGAQGFFNVQADIVTYGKTLGGGLPVGVVCGRSELMRRFRDSQPANVSFARGTFNSHPWVLGSMAAFLDRVSQPQYQTLYENTEQVWNTRVETFNNHLSELELPVRIHNLCSILVVTYTKPARYNWMFQFYLKKHGLHLSWVGTGRLIMSLNYSDDDFAQVVSRFLEAGQEMQQAGWWHSPPGLTDTKISRMVLKEMLCVHVPVLRRFLFAVQPEVKYPETTQVQT